MKIFLILLILFPAIMYGQDSLKFSSYPVKNNFISTWRPFGYIDSAGKKWNRAFDASVLLMRENQTGFMPLANVSGLVAALGGKQSTVSVTTNGTSGAATWDGTTLNIPVYTVTGGGSFDTSNASVNAQLKKFFSDHQPTTDSYFGANNFEVVSGTTFLYGGNTNPSASPGSTIAGSMTVSISGHTRRSKLTLTVTSPISLSDNLDLVVVTYGQTFLNAPGPGVTPGSTFPTILKLKNVTTTSLTIAATGSGSLAAGTYIIYLDIEPL